MKASAGKIKIPAMPGLTKSATEESKYEHRHPD